jgi:putative oxidoreductase
MVKKIFAPGHDSVLTSVALLVLRLWLGLTMLFEHGLVKVNHFSDDAPYFPDPFHIGRNLSMGLCTFAETAGAILLVLGLITRFGALTLVIDLSVAFFMVHKTLASGELAFIYLAGYVALLIAGGGKFSLDKALFGKGGSGK